MGKTFILLMLGIVIWLGKSGLNAQESNAGNIERILRPILKHIFNHNLQREEFAGAVMFPNRITKINLVKAGDDYMLQKQNQPVDANT